MKRVLSYVCGMGLSVLLSASAWAQFGPGSGLQPGGPPAPTATGKNEKDGPAEAAPKENIDSLALQPLAAWPQQREKSLSFFQLNGYFRFRSYLFHGLNLGFFEGPTTNAPRSPFHIPFSEYGSTGMAGTGPGASCAARSNSNCRADDISSADMRLRLEPTINVTELVRIKAQIDIFDNLVLGSTPETYFFGSAGTRDAQFTALSRTQTSPQAGLNSVYSSIRAKRAWAEVKTPFGELRFGRMPNHWGMGMLFNHGDCLDCDFGNNSDRVMFSTKLWGHFIAFMWDWVASGPTTAQTIPSANQGVFYDADPIDNTSQWVLSLGKMTKAEEVKEKTSQGKAVFNYGGYFVFRLQSWAESRNPGVAIGNDQAALRDSLVNRDAKIFIPDVWLRLDYRTLHLELEGAMMVGSIGRLDDIYPTNNVRGSVSILSGGFAFKSRYGFLRDTLRIYFDAGFGSGDDAEDPRGVVHFRYADWAPVNNRIGRFTFDPDYHVDLILFRRILGAVSNATYFKPGISYDIFDNFGARADIIYSIANRPISYPGNSSQLGLELDFSLLYKNEEEGFYAGLTYGVLFPFSALSFPAEIYPGFANNSSTAQTVQARFAVKF